MLKNFVKRYGKRLVAETHNHIWLIAILFFGVTDCLTTFYGLNNGYVESNPIANQFINSNILTIIGYKSVAFAILYPLYRTIPKPYAYEIPYMTALAGIVITIHNALLVL